MNLDPFDNTVVTFKVNGQELRAILRTMQPAVSGIRYRMENGEIAEVEVGERPLADDHIYSGASNSYFAERALKNLTIIDTGKIRRDFIIEAIRNKGLIHPAYDGRRIILQPSTEGNIAGH